MTSVTLPSSSGTLNGGYSSPGTGEISNNQVDSDSHRTTKRSLLTLTSTDPCKKRRKQSTPIRISTTESESSSQEGKPSPGDPTFRCPICQAPFPQQELLQNHLVCDHPVECKKEPPQPQFMETMLRQELPWAGEMPGKEWMGFNPASAMFMALPQFSQPESVPMKPIRIFNPDAYCDLCNKEFCNKYFLKTHKANKHGIYMDSSSSEAFPAVAVPSLATGLKMNPAKSEPNPFHAIFSNAFESELNVSNGQSCSSDSEKVFADDQPCRGSPGAAQTESTSVKNELQDASDQDSSFRLKKAGVMNPKAFCEICCKEYCNKYFLRTHKLKRHGIYIPDDRDKPENFSASSSVQTSPLNLIMTEQASDSKTTSPNNITCDICCIKFQNASLAHMHGVTVHGKVEKPPNAEAISEDLRKLQTMILQLNELEPSKDAPACGVCNKEFENRFHLHAHTMSEHGILIDEAEKPGETDNNNTVCDICGKEVHNAEEMSKHVLKYHSGDGEKPPGRISALLPERRVSTNVTPTSSYCEICNKELCNKYFMKTHMQRMHGIEIENGAQIGGVVCDICNKELCSKYFLRVHKHNTHGIVEYGSSLLPPRKPEGEAPPETDPGVKPADLADLSHRYFTHFTEVCGICSRRFRSTKWLKTHLVTDHGQAGVDKWAEIEVQSRGGKPAAPGVEGGSNLKIPGGEPQNVGIQNFVSSLFGVEEGGSKMYQCSFCPFTSPLLPLLFVHERSHSEREALQRHVLAQHPFLLPAIVKEEKEAKEPAEEMGRVLHETAKKTQWPATYAVPQDPEDASRPGYVMQAFLLEENASERRVLPSVVFLPMAQKQPSPISVTFTLTPA